MWELLSLEQIEQMQMAVSLDNVEACYQDKDMHCETAGCRE